MFDAAFVSFVELRYSAFVQTLIVDSVEFRGLESKYLIMYSGQFWVARGEDLSEPSSVSILVVVFFYLHLSKLSMRSQFVDT